VRARQASAWPGKVVARPCKRSGGPRCLTAAPRHPSFSRATAVPDHRAKAADHAIEAADRRFQSSDLDEECANHATS